MGKLRRTLPRSPRSLKERGTESPSDSGIVVLSPRAMSVVEEIASEMSMTPSEVLMDSLTLYKKVLDARKPSATAEPTTAS